MNETSGLVLRRPMTDFMLNNWTRVVPHLSALYQLVSDTVRSPLASRSVFSFELFTNKISYKMRMLVKGKVRVCHTTPDIAMISN